MDGLKSSVRGLCRCIRCLVFHVFNPYAFGGVRFRKTAISFMSFSLGSLLGGAASSAVSGGLGVLGNIASAWGTNSAKESLNKNITQTNYKIQKKYDEWTIAQDKAYEQWFQNYLYSLQNKEYYNLAQKYATHSARWAVEGLKAAGLNPILAGIDSNLSSNMGNANPQTSGHRVGGGSVHGASVGSGVPPVNLTSVAANMQSHAAAQQAQTDTSIKQQSAPSLVRTNELQPAAVAASTAESMARAKLISAQADKTQVDTENARKNAGNPSPFGYLERTRKEASDAVDDLAHDASSFVSQLVGSFGLDHSAKQLKSIPPSKPAPTNYSDQELAYILMANGTDGMYEGGFSSEQIGRAMDYKHEHLKDMPIWDDPKLKKYYLNTPASRLHRNPPQHSFGY